LLPVPPFALFALPITPAALFVAAPQLWGQSGTGILGWILGDLHPVGLPPLVFAMPLVSVLGGFAVAKLWARVRAKI
jgi:hypothetical protein